MPTVKQIFVNLPVASLPRAMEFFGALGFRFDPMYTNDDGACLVLGDNIYAMLLARPFFEGFMSKQICDSSAACEVINALAVESREEVDALVRRGLDAGGSASGEPRDDGFMYQHGFQDPDGHLWEVFHAASGAEPPWDSAD